MVEILRPHGEEEEEEVMLGTFRPFPDPADYLPPPPPELLILPREVAAEVHQQESSF